MKIKRNNFAKRILLNVTKSPNELMSVLLLGNPILDIWTDRSSAWKWVEVEFEIELAIKRRENFGKRRT